VLNDQCEKKVKEGICLERMRKSVKDFRVFSVLKKIQTENL
jgi:hypothetical protein